VPLAYYAAGAGQEFWADHWGGHTVSELLDVARASPLTTLVTDALPRGGRVLEAGCGLGQYVHLLREWGWSVIGVDWTLAPLRESRTAGRVPLAVSDLRRLAVRAEMVDAYVSLGVVEHDPEGPDAILREARRVLRPGGMLLVSVPYVNGLRRLGGWWIRHRGLRVRRGGGQFYQFAFSRREIRRIVEANGFRVLSATPYDPARILRRALGHAPRPSRSAPNAGPVPTRAAGEVRRRGTPRALRGLLYSRPALVALGHMILLVAETR